MPISKRDPAKERYWRAKIAQQSALRMTIVEFCKREGLNEHTYRAWQAEIKHRDQEKAEKLRDSSVAFVPVTVTTSQPVSPGDKSEGVMGSPIEVTTPCGHILRLPPQKQSESKVDIRENRLYRDRLSDHEKALDSVSN